MEINVIKDFRNFKAGESFNFTEDVTVIVGDMGSGKSSLVSSLRGNLLGEDSSTGLAANTLTTLGTNITVDENFDKIFCYDSIADDGLRFHNCSTAMALIENGGHSIMSLSHGESTTFYLDKLLSEITVYRKNNPRASILVILDEFDRGYSLQYQTRSYRILDYLTNKQRCKVVCVTHSYFLIKQVSK